MHKTKIAVAGFAVLLTGGSEDCAGFCEQVAMQYDTNRYDRFEITDIIDYTAEENPRPEVYVRFTGMRQTAATEKRNVTCHFDLDSGTLAATEIYVDGRKLTEDIVAQYNATLAN